MLAIPPSYGLSIFVSLPLVIQFMEKKKRTPEKPSMEIV
jgi:hypothetical protein